MNMNLPSGIQKCLLGLGFALSACLTHAATIYVNPGDNINTKVNSAVAGDTVLVAPGTYGTIVIKNKHFTGTQPVIVKRNGTTGTVTVRNASTWDGHAVDLQNVRYIAFENIAFQGGLRAGWVQTCFAIIFKGCQFHGSSQEGIHILSTNYVDIRGGKVFNTGQNPAVAKWGEGIYVGSGSAPDNCSRIWIEGVEIYSTGKGEAIDFKPGVKNSTIRGCNIHDISPGTSDQYNGSAIGINGYDYAGWTLDAAQNIWVESNTVTNVTGGLYNRGIMAFGSGVIIKNNIVSNCAMDGIHLSNWQNKFYTNRLYGNTVTNCNPNVVVQTGVLVDYTNANNTMVKQSWYP